MNMTPNELLIRAQAANDELSVQRLMLGDRAAQMAAEFAVAKARIKELEAELAKMLEKKE